MGSFAIKVRGSWRISIVEFSISPERIRIKWSFKNKN